MPLSRGDVVAGAFEVEHSLEVDSAIEAYRARHLLTGKRVLLKILKLRVAWCEALVERARGLEVVAADSIARCIHQGAFGRGRWCFAFEWLANESTESKLPRVASPADAAAIGARLAAGLAELHARGLSHGHVRPELCVVDVQEPARSKLADFVVAPDRMHLVSNARYVAPERVVGGSASPEADVYALGVMLRELLSSRESSLSATRVGVYLETLFDTPDEVDAIDPALASWVTRMLAFEPLERPEAVQVESALAGLTEGRALPTLSAPTTREQSEGRIGTALALLVIRPPPGKEPEAVGLDGEWRRDVEGLGLQLLSLPEGMLVGRIRGRTANAVAVSAGLVARATQQCAFRASVVAGLLDDAAEPSRGDEEVRRRSRVAALRAEIADIANVAGRTPASVTRFTSRLAEYVGASIGLKPSADSFLLAPPSAPRPKRGGTLEIETTKMAATSKRRKTGEIDIEPRKPKRGKGGTLVIEPGPEQMETKPAVTPEPSGVPAIAPGADAAAAIQASPSELPPRRGKLDTLVMEMDTAPLPDASTDAASNQAAAAEDPSKNAVSAEAVHAEPTEPLDATREAPVAELPSMEAPPSEVTRVAPMPSKAAWGRNQPPPVLPGSEAPTLEIEVSEELRELSRVEEKLKTRPGSAAD